jgi:hypothetical protein
VSRIDRVVVTRVSVLLLLSLAGVLLSRAFAGPYGVPDNAWVKVYRPSPRDCYFRVVVDDDKNVPPPSFGDLPGWCVDLYNTINLGDWHYAELTVKLTTDGNWGKINWILNNKHTNWKVTQGAIWRILYPSLPWDGSGGIEDLGNLSLDDTEEAAADTLANSAQSHSGFLPGPTQIVAVYVNPGSRVQKFIFEYRIPGGEVPEFGAEVPAVASLALGLYALLLRRRGRAT